MEDTKSKDTFCPFPFMHLNMWMDGRLKPCCVAKDYIPDVNIFEDGLEKSYNSEAYKQLRVDMMNGKENKLCSGCYDSEKGGAYSYRNELSDRYSDLKEGLLEKTKEDGETKLEFEHLDLRPSNICNLKCRTCSPAYSTNWIAEHKDYVKKSGWTNYDDMHKTRTFELDIKSEYIENVKHIYIAGGEPLYMKQMYNFIDGLENKENIGLFINTNLTVINKKTFFDKFKDFKLVHLHISCDGIGEIGEFVRTNVKWDLFEENLKFVKDLRENPEINLAYNIQATVSILNCYHIFDMMRYMLDREYIYGNVDFTFNWVSEPYWYNVKNFNGINLNSWGEMTDDITSEIIELYKKERENIPELIQNPLYEDEMMKNPLWDDVTNFIVFLESKHWPNPKTLDMLRANIKHGLRYNNTEIPKDLEYINKLIV